MEVRSEELIRALVRWLADRKRIIVNTEEYADVAEEVLGYREPRASWYDAVYEALEPVLQEISSGYCEICAYVVWPRELGVIPHEIMRTIELIYDIYYEHHDYDEYDNTVDDIAAHLIYRFLSPPFDDSEPLAWMLYRLAEHYDAIDEVVDLGEKKYFRIGDTWISYTRTYKNLPGFWYSVLAFSEPPEQR